MEPKRLVSKRKRVPMKPREYSHFYILNALELEIAEGKIRCNHTPYCSDKERYVCHKPHIMEWKPESRRFDSTIQK